jgi:hypothetical protein
MKVRSISRNLGHLLALALVLRSFGCSVYGSELLTGAADGGLGGLGDTGTMTQGRGGADGGATGGALVGGAAGAGRGGAPDWDASAMPGGSAGQGPTCSGTVTIPPVPSPAGGVDSSADVGEIVLAMYEVDMGDRKANLVNAPEAYLDVGLDLDGICTRLGGAFAGECELPKWGTGFFDGLQGIDNAFGAFVQIARGVAGDSFSSEQLTRQIRAGGTNLLFRVRGYNGEPDDAEVNVAVFVAPPFASGPDGGGAPTWDGTDAWPVATDSLQSPSDPNPLESPRYVDPVAYVTERRLVAALPFLQVRLEIGVSALSMTRLDVSIARASIVCDMNLGDAGQYQADNCILGGRVNSNGFLVQLPQFSDPTSTTGLAPLCADRIHYQTFKEAICTAADTADDTTQGGTCNSLSLGIHFSARPALLRGPSPLDALDDRCPDEISPRFDCCETLESGITTCPD